MTLARGKRILKGMDVRTPFRSVTEYREILAAITKVHAREMDRSDGKTTARGVMTGLARWSTFQYLQNNARYLKRARGRGAIPVGTTVNEAEHAIMKAHFANVMEQSKDRLRLALRCFVVARMVRWMLHSKFKLAVGRKESETSYRRILAILTGVLKEQPLAVAAKRSARKRPARGAGGAKASPSKRPKSRVA